MRSAQMRYNKELQSLAADAQQRIAINQQRDKMRRLMQSIANGKEEVPVADLLLAAELANVSMTEEQKKLYFTTPYANKFASTWEPNTPRTDYGLECSPRAVKWRQFDAALKHARLQNHGDVASALEYYANKEAQALADEKRRDEEAKALAQARAQASNTNVKPTGGISDDQLKMVHKIVKQRLATQYSEIRTAFRAFDKDHSGNISAKECTEALLALNVGVPRKWIDHLVNIADYDRDGEINYKEFARILTSEDITKIKKEGAEEEGLVDSERKDWYNEENGITKKDIFNAQSKIRDMLMERGGLTKMFRNVDEDKSGWCSRAEMRRLVMNLNLETVIRPKVIEEIINMMDVDKDDHINFKEYARVITAENILDLGVVKKNPMGGQWRAGQGN